MTIPTTVHTAAIGVVRHADSDTHLRTRTPAYTHACSCKGCTRAGAHPHKAPMAQQLWLRLKKAERCLPRVCRTPAVRCMRGESSGRCQPYRRRRAACAGGRSAAAVASRRARPVRRQSARSPRRAHTCPVHASARLRMHERACAAREELGVCANTGAYPMAFSFTSDTKYVPAVQNGHGRWHPGTAWYPGQQSAGLRGVRFGQSGYVRTPARARPSE